MSLQTATVITSDQRAHFWQSVAEMEQAKGALQDCQGKFSSIPPSAIAPALQAIHTKLESAYSHLQLSQVPNPHMINEWRILKCSYLLLKGRLPSLFPTPEKPAEMPALPALADGSKSASPAVSALPLSPPPEAKESKASKASSFVRAVPTGIIRRHSHNCWVNAGAQFIRAIPSLYDLVVADIKDFRDFFETYEKCRKAGKSVPETSSQKVREYLSGRISVSSDALSMEDAHEGLAPIMSRYKGPKIREVRNKVKPGDTKEHEITCSIIPISIANHNNQSLEKLFDAGFMTANDELGGAESYFHEPPRELFFQLVRSKRVMSKYGQYLGNVKISDAINCGMSFELSPDRVLSKKGATYACDAFIVHEAAHYVAYVKVNNHWHMCDDADVKRVSDTAALRALKKAYIIHYAL